MAALQGVKLAVAEEGRLQPVVRKFSSFEEADEAEDEFYRKLTNQEALDIMIELVGREQRAAGGRLERVCRITQLAKL